MLNNVQNRTGASLDNICYFFDVTEDEEYAADSGTMAYCAECPITSAEHSNAAQNNIRPEKMLMVSTEGYRGESRVMYNEEIYIVYRIYQRVDGYCELYLTARAGV